VGEGVDLEVLRRLTPEQLASDFHHNYVARARGHRFVPRPEQAVPWEQLPEAARSLMIWLIRSLVFEDLNLPAILDALDDLEELRREVRTLLGLYDDNGRLDIVVNPDTDEETVVAAASNYPAITAVLVAREAEGVERNG